MALGALADSGTGYFIYVRKLNIMQILEKYVKPEDKNKPLSLSPFTGLIVKRKSDNKIICHITNEFEKIEDDYTLETYKK